MEEISLCFGIRHERIMDFSREGDAYSLSLSLLIPLPSSSSSISLLSLLYLISLFSVSIFPPFLSLVIFSPSENLLFFFFAAATKAKERRTEGPELRRQKGTNGERE